MISLDSNNISGNISQFSVILNPSEYDFIGFLYNAHYEIKIEFLGIREFLTSLEDFFDTYNFPQSTHIQRKFVEHKNKKGSLINMKNEKVEIQSGDATFTIHVQFRQNASWQGSIHWIQGNKTQRFRSELEMIKLMIDAMDYEKETDKLVGWNE
ncbi:MAG: hypothetical protein WCF96_07365 [Eubacteriales bacterium]